jgi:hypothetical protein
MPLADIVSPGAKAEREGQLGERIRFLCRDSLLIVDEIVYLPVIPTICSPIRQPPVRARRD